MANKSILNRVMGYSPNNEMIIRRLYRKKSFFKVLSKLNIKKKKEPKRSNINFDLIINYLKKLGIKEGDILIVTSAYKPLKPAGLSPLGIVDLLIELIGNQGTLVMPVIRRFPESPSEEDALTADISDIIFEYNIKESKIWTGIIPKTLMKMSGAITSRFPLNTVTAYGKVAKKMMEKELDEELPTPNGINSAWKYCADNNAWVVSIGTDLAGSLTMIHTVEDVKKYDWPVKEWYRKKKFKIIDGNQVINKTVLERHPKWGMLHFAERTLSKDLLDDGIMKSTEIEGVLIESLRSKPLLDYLDRRNRNAYPYFWLKKHIK